MVTGVGDSKRTFWCSDGWLKYRQFDTEGDSCCCKYMLCGANRIKNGIIMEWWLVQVTARELSLSKCQWIKLQLTQNFTPPSVNTVTVKLFFKFTGHSYCSPLPLDVIKFVIITKQTTAWLLCICWTLSCEQLCSVHLAKDFTATQTAQFLVYTLWKTFRQRCGVFKPKFRSVFSVWCNCGTCLCFLPARTKNISTVLWLCV